MKNTRQIEIKALTPLMEEVRKLKLKWFGHLMRNSQSLQRNLQWQDGSETKDRKEDGSIDTLECNSGRSDRGKDSVMIDVIYRVPEEKRDDWLIDQ